MCGRYTLIDPIAIARSLLRELGILLPPEAPRYNVAPGQTVTTLWSDPGRLRSGPMRWGLVPAWAQEESPRIAPINARSEEAFKKGLFRDAVQRRRALFPCDGFFEWKNDGVGPKAPHLIRLQGGEPFVMAGLFEEGAPGRGPSCAVLTTSANETMAPIHARMPVILAPAAARRWLAPGPLSEDEFRNLCRPFAAAPMVAQRVSALVNDVRHTGPEVVMPAAEPGEWALDAE